MSRRAALGLLAALAFGAGVLVFMRRADAAARDPLADALAELEGIGGAIVGALTPGPWTPPEAARPYLGAIYAAEDRVGMPRNLLARQLHEESRYRPEIIDGRVRSAAGAIGIAQFMPATAAEFKIDPTNAQQSIDAAAEYMRRLYNRFGTWQLALAAYNWGQGNVERKDLPDGVVGDDWPLETKLYVALIAGDVGIG